MQVQTLYDKLWTSHVIADYEEGVSLIYIDRQLLHDISSPQSFQGLRQKHRRVRRNAAHMAVADHAVPTQNRHLPIADVKAREQVALLARNSGDFEIKFIPTNDPRHGIVHVIGPEQGFTLPGITLVCGDSHTSTHGAFGALAFGIGSSESECVLATQTLRQRRAKNMLVRIDGALPRGVFAKDVALAVVGKLGASGATGYAIEFGGTTAAAMSMADRMTLCNMSIEAGARSGMVAPDDTTFAFLANRPLAPQGRMWEQALDYWKTLRSDHDAVFDRTTDLDASELQPQVTWGTSPDQVLAVSARIPEPDAAPDESTRMKWASALAYMGLRPGIAIQDIAIDYVFIGSCTNSRIEDLRAAAEVIRGQTIADSVKGIVVPGSGLVKQQAELEGLRQVFVEAGFEWRDPGCSLCVAINDDRLAPGQRCASTSNRNFEGRQGIGARTHLMSPAMAAAAAIAGHIVDIRDLGTPGAKA